MIQASNTKQCIFVIADGQEEPVKLANTIHDSVASKSLISNTKAIASCGMIRRNAQKTIIDHTGRTYTSSSTISLRWYYDDGNQTFPETFYIVDSTANQLSYDAILRKTAESPLEAVVPQAHPVYPAPQGTDDDRKKARSDRAVTNQTVYERQVQEQRDRIRDAAVARQARTKHG